MFKVTDGSVRLMVLRQSRVFFTLGALLLTGPALLSGCGTSGPDFVVRDDPWRAPEERACLASGAVRETQFIRTRSSLGGPSVCGAETPFEMSGADGGRVTLEPAAMLRCPMIPTIDRWVQDVVEPAARFQLGQRLVGLSVMSSYSCRPVNGVSGGIISEHAYANAVDIGGFKLEDGRTISVLAGWSGGSGREQAFLRQVHDGACRYFTTVLGPNYNGYHRNHFHLDLAHHGRDGLMNICK